MAALMIVILLKFNQVGERMEVSYEAKPAITTMEKCKQVDDAMKKMPKDNAAIVLCFPSKKAKSA